MDCRDFRRLCEAAIEMLAVLYDNLDKPQVCRKCAEVLTEIQAAMNAMPVAADLIARVNQVGAHRLMLVDRAIAMDLTLPYRVATEPQPGYSAGVTA